VKTWTVLAAIAIAALAWPQTTHAQGSPSSNAATAVQLAAARKANAALMQQYSWTSRTEILEAGAVKDIRIELVNYGPGGQLQRSLLNDQSAPLPFGFLRRAIDEHRKKELEEYLTGLRALLEQYTLSSAGKILDFMNQAAISGPDAGGLLQMTGTNVAMPGDTFTVWIDARTRQTRRVHAGTYFQGSPVSLSATFKTLASGLTHLAFGEAVVPAKQLSVQVQDFDYNRNN
jgi:hypothetical protein